MLDPIEDLIQDCIIIIHNTQSYHIFTYKYNKTISGYYLNSLILKGGRDTKW